MIGRAYWKAPVITILFIIMMMMVFNSILGCILLTSELVDLFYSSVQLHQVFRNFSLKRSMKFRNVEFSFKSYVITRGLGFTYLFCIMAVDFCIVLFVFMSIKSKSGELRIENSALSSVHWRVTIPLLLAESIFYAYINAYLNI